MLTTTTQIDAIQLHVLLLAEITRYKFGKDGMSLTNKTIERGARHRFADAVGIKQRSTAKEYLIALGEVYAMNGKLADYNRTMSRFGLVGEEFIVAFSN